MEWANVTEVHTLPSAKQIFLLEEHALYKDNFATGNGELQKAITAIAQRDGNMFLLFRGH